MNDLTLAQHAELDALVCEFMRNRKYDGLEVVLLLRGRGIDKVVIGKGDADVAPGMLASGYRSAVAYKRGNA